MSRPNEDPLLRSARREMLVTFGIVLVAMVYTVGYSWLYGYNREKAELIWGVPDWVMWGILLPWGICLVISTWYSFWFMADVPLGKEEEETEVGGSEETP